MSKSGKGKDVVRKLLSGGLELLKGAGRVAPLAKIKSEIISNKNDDHFTASGKMNWPRLAGYIIMGVVLVAAIAGAIPWSEALKIILSLTLGGEAPELTN